MMELLVTIVVAGIAFLAITPLVVTLVAKNSGDLFRNVALNIAQDKLEKIRSLDYGDVTAANLESGTYGGGIFGEKDGSRIVQDYGSGPASRTMYIDYHVADYPEVGVLSRYKTVRVTVSWDAPPAPVKPVVLQTIVYRQYAGPTLQSFSTSPRMDETGVISTSASEEWKITLTATPSSPWIGSTGHVVFAVLDSHNVAITPPATVTTADIGYDANTGSFSKEFDTRSWPSGQYSLTAQPTSTSGYDGETAYLYPRVSIESTGTEPAAPTNLTATAGDSSVTLAWAAVVGIDHYELYRGPSAGGPCGEPLATWPATSPTKYTDNTAANNTPYYYAVTAVDATGTSSLFSNVASATPESATDTTPPGTPSILGVSAVAGKPRLALAWTDVSGTDTDFGGQIGYAVYRASSSTGPWTKVYDTMAMYPAPANRWTDQNVGWGVLYWYRVQAYDGAPNFSFFSNILGNTSVAHPTAAVTINNTDTVNSVNVWLQRTSDGHWFTSQGVDVGTARPGGLNIKKNKSAPWSLPAGDDRVGSEDRYSVYYAYDSRTPPTCPAKGLDLTTGSASPVNLP